MIETAILEVNQKKNRTTIVTVKTSAKEITTDNRELSETAPSCNDCVATIVTDQFTRTVKGVGMVCPAFWNGKESVISPGSQNMEGSRDLNSN